MFRLFHLGLIIMVGAILTNLHEFEEIDKATRHNYQAIYTYKSGNIFDIGAYNSNGIRQRVAAFYYFGIISPDSTIILPSGGLRSWFELDLGMIGFGRARKILYRDYDPKIASQEFDGDGYEVDMGRYLPNRKSSRRDLNERFSIFRRSPKARTFVVLAPEGDPGRDKPMLFVDIDLVGPSLREALGDDM